MPSSVKQLVDVVGQPLPGLRIAEVQESAARPAEDPLGMVLGQPGVRVDPLRLEPDDRLDALRVRVVADRPQAAREPLPVHFPGAGLGPADGAARDTSRRPSTSARSGSLRPGSGRCTSSGSLRWRRPSRRRGASCSRTTPARATCRPAGERCGPSIQRRQTFWPRIQSLVQNWRTINGVRISSPGSSLRCVNSCPARTRSPSSSSRVQRDDHWPGQPTATITPDPVGTSRLK